MRHGTFHLGSRTVHASIEGDKIYSAVPLSTDELNEIRNTDRVLTATQALETVHAHPPKWRKRWRAEHAGAAQGGSPGDVRPKVDNLQGSASQIPQKDPARSNSLFRGQESETQKVVPRGTNETVTIEPGDSLTVEAKAPPRKPWFGR